MAIDWFLERLAPRGEQQAFVWTDRAYSYAWLAAAVGKWQDRLRQGGIVPGQVVSVHGDYSPSLSALLLALTANGNIVVPIASAAAENQGQFTELAQAEVAFHFQSDDSWRIEPQNMAVTHELLLSLRQGGRPGLVLFSSGSTGKSKGIVHDLSRLLEKFRTPRAAFRTIGFLLLDHIGGINTLLHTLANGGTLITPAGRTPGEVCAAIGRHRAELLPSSPTFLNLMLVAETHQQYDLSSLKLITYGTEVMPESILRRLTQALPGVTLAQTYGLSELGILRAKSRSSDSLWVKVGGEGVETRVVDGVLWVRTSAAMLGYLNAPSPFSADGWFNTGDRVEQDGEYLRILGRESDWINVGGQKVYPAEVESVLLEMENVLDATVYGERHPLTGHMVAVTVLLAKPEDLTGLKQRMRAHCAGRLEPFKIPIKVIVAEQAAHSDRFKKRRPRQGP
ncbi:MAG TPA: fatty acid--CoA ligase family protein [Symbiobacteriaceae bacterium]|nr:fatty acid--CoA ligase family protein [Symbiobacteriaceae bacterium]